MEIGRLGFVGFGTEISILLAFNLAWINSDRSVLSILPSYAFRLRSQFQFQIRTLPWQLLA